MIKLFEMGLPLPIIISFQSMGQYTPNSSPQLPLMELWRPHRLFKYYHENIEFNCWQL